MIKISIEKDNDIIKKITIKGHSGYAEAGSDIVCSSVSTMAITTINACLRIDESSITYKDSDGFLEMKINKEDKIINSLIENMVNLLEELKSNYPKNIQIN